MGVRGAPGHQERAGRRLLGDAQSLLYNAKTSPDLYKVTFNDEAGPYGIGINKENSEFRDALRAALLSLVENGTYDKVLEEWGQKDYAMPELPLKYRSRT